MAFITAIFSHRLPDKAGAAAQAGSCVWSAQELPRLWELDDVYEGPLLCYLLPSVLSSSH